MCWSVCGRLNVVQLVRETIRADRSGNAGSLGPDAQAGCRWAVSICSQSDDKRRFRYAGRSCIDLGLVGCRGLGFVVLARRGSRPIAAAVFFRFGKNAVYKYGASDKRFQEFRANNLVMWQGIQLLARTGVEKLHFGRTDSENAGLRRFKLSWDTQEETIDYFRVDPSGRQCLPSPRRNSAFHKNIFGRMPLVFNRLAGSILYPHLD